MGSELQYCVFLLKGDKLREEVALESRKNSKKYHFIMRWVSAEMMQIEAFVCCLFLGTRIQERNLQVEEVN